jgi:uncharacterized membrane protein required for colicin V production
MNILDVFMALGLIVGVLIGFVRGVVRQAMGLISIYISMVIAVWAHRIFGSAFMALFSGLTEASANILGFVTVLIIFLNVLGFIARDIEKNAKWVEKIPPLLDQTGGLILGFVVSAFWLGLVGTALSVIGHAPWIGAEELGRSLVTLVNHSVMATVFRYAFWLSLYAIAPWVPDGLLQIFVTPL